VLDEGGLQGKKTDPFESGDGGSGQASGEEALQLPWPYVAEVLAWRAGIGEGDEERKLR